VEDHTAKAVYVNHRDRRDFHPQGLRVAR